MGKRRRIASCNVHEDFDQDDPGERHILLEWRGGVMFQPTGIQVGYQMRDADWQTGHISVYGRRILKGGGLGQSVSVRYYSDSEQRGAPAWIKQWAADNRPDQLPWRDEA